MLPLKLTDAQVQAFERDGYLAAGPLLDEQQVASLRQELDRVVERYDTGTAEREYIGQTAAFCQRRDCFLQVTNVRELSEPFAQVATARPLVAAAERLLGAAPLRLFADGVLFKNGRDRALNDWHQDGPAFDILDPPAALTAWAALDDVTEADGCVCFATGSHRWPRPPAPALGRLAEMLAAARAGREGPPDARAFRDAGLHLNLARRGEVHLHHGLTWHCSLENSSGRPRRAFAIHYVPEGIRYVAAGGHFLKAFVESADGQPLAGRHFPLLRG